MTSGRSAVWGDLLLCVTPHCINISLSWQRVLVAVPSASTPSYRLIHGRSISRSTGPSLHLSAKSQGRSLWSVMSTWFRIMCSIYPDPHASNRIESNRSESICLSSFTYHNILFTSTRLYFHFFKFLLSFDVTLSVVCFNSLSTVDSMVQSCNWNWLLCECIICLLSAELNCALWTAALLPHMPATGHYVFSHFTVPSALLFFCITILHGMVDLAERKKCRSSAAQNKICYISNVIWFLRMEIRGRAGRHLPSSSWLEDGWLSEWVFSSIWNKGMPIWCTGYSYSYSCFDVLDQGIYSFNLRRIAIGFSTLETTNWHHDFDFDYNFVSRKHYIFFNTIIFSNFISISRDLWKNNYIPKIFAYGETGISNFEFRNNLLNDECTDEWQLSYYLCYTAILHTCVQSV